jgi:DUF4097 and DUF4098 domain-containing protein YvlB
MKIILFLLLASTLAFCQTITGSSGDYNVVIEKNYEVESGGTLNIENAQGDISITSAVGNQVVIREELAADVITREELNEIVQQEMAAYGRRNDVITLAANSHHPGIERDFIITVPEKFNLQVHTGNGDVSVSRVNGQIQIESAGGDVQLADISGSTQVTTAGGDLEFTTISGSLRASTAGGDVSLKNIFGESSINTSGGDIELINSKNRITINTSGGDITLRKISGDLDAQTMGGDVTLTDAEGKRIHLNSMGGDIVVNNCSGQTDASTQGGDISAEHITGELSARTMGGGIEITDLQAGATAVSMGGDISIEMTLKDMKKPHKIQAETTGGDLNITLPARLPATINAEVRLNRRSGNRNDIFSDFPLTKMSPDETGDRIIRSKGEINGGGDPIDLKTNGGSIYIKKGL